MRVTFTLLLLVSALAANYSGVPEVEAISPINDQKYAGNFSIEGRQLRGSLRPEGEERAGPNPAAISNLLHSNSAVYMADEFPRLSKKAKALAVLLTLGLTAGLNYGALKALKSTQSKD